MKVKQVRHPFTWPLAIGCLPVEQFLWPVPPKRELFTDEHPFGPMPSSDRAKAKVMACIRNCAKKGHNALTNCELFGDLDCSESWISWSEGKVPCLVRGHPCGPWSTRRCRRLSVAERARLQPTTPHTAHPPLTHTHQAATTL